MIQAQFLLAIMQRHFLLYRSDIPPDFDGSGSRLPPTSSDSLLFPSLLDLPDDVITGTISPVYDDEDIDACETWMNCSNTFLQSYVEKLVDLPACPCFYPINLPYDDKVWDDNKVRHTSERDASRRQRGRTVRATSRELTTPFAAC
ncbi:PREDICTED: isthmin-2-like [Priapulus caudatus]|uniref:Isthmin-2-like n=1 Tax=Priapulus caudatus TaxID=37621 RepID=A0ABM1F6P0_PRICU|nr:PREDICTED: isthmin-2-like [Priapulus caudatus]